MNLNLNAFGRGEESEDSLLRFIDRMLEKTSDRRKTQAQREEEQLRRAEEEDRKRIADRELMARMLVSPSAKEEGLWDRLQTYGVNEQLPGYSVNALHLVATPDSVRLVNGRRKPTNRRERDGLVKHLETVTRMDGVDYTAKDADGYTAAESAWIHTAGYDRFATAAYLASLTARQDKHLGRYLIAALHTADCAEGQECSTHWQHAASLLTDLGPYLDATIDLKIFGGMTPRKWARSILPSGHPLHLILAGPSN